MNTIQKHNQAKAQSVCFASLSVSINILFIQREYLCRYRCLGKFPIRVSQRDTTCHARTMVTKRNSVYCQINISLVIAKRVFLFREYKTCSMRFHRFDLSRCLEVRTKTVETNLSRKPFHIFTAVPTELLGSISSRFMGPREN